MSRVVKPLLAGVAVLACVATPVVLVSERGQEPAAGGSGTTYEEWLAGPPDSLPGADVRRRAEEIYSSFAGTTEERDALGVVNAFRSRAGLEACMDEAGYADPRYNWAFGRMPDPPDDPFAGTFWFQIPFHNDKSAAEVAGREFGLAEEFWNRDHVPADERAAWEACMKADAARPRQDRRSVEPRGARLVGRWWAVTRAYQDDVLPPWTSWRDCIEAAHPLVLHFPHTDLEDFFEGGGRWELPGREDIPEDPADPAQWMNPRWQRFLAVEDDYEQADWACRKDVYERYIDGLVPVMEAFAKEHAAEIAETREQWAAIARQAAALGY